MKRRLPLIFVAVVTVICLVAASVAAVASGAGGSAVAYSVNGTKVSQATVDHQLKELADSKAAKDNARQQGTIASDTSVSSSTTAAVLTQRIILDLLRDAAARRGVKVSDADRAALRPNVKEQLVGLPESFQELQVDLLAYQGALGFDDTAFNTFLVSAIRRADVTVDARYGTWSPRQGVCPPTGCATSSAGAGG